MSDRLQYESAGPKTPVGPMSWVLQAAWGNVAAPLVGGILGTCLMMTHVAWRENPLAVAGAIMCAGSLLCMFFLTPIGVCFALMHGWQTRGGSLARSAWLRPIAVALLTPFAAFVCAMACVAALG